jgi:hypothetical protein
MMFSCKDCQQRHDGCHATCETYKTERAAYLERKAAYDRERYINGELVGQRSDAVAKIKKKKRKKNGWC